MRLVYESDIVVHRSPTELLDKRGHELRTDEETLAYVRSLVRYVADNRDELDSSIGRVAPTWPVDQMARLDVAILRIAISEIDGGDVPDAVVINEAVELAKRYCSAGSARMINGALGSYVRNRAVSAGS
jgi:N utilization substance protein B